MPQYCWWDNSQSLSYRMGWFKRRFVQNRHNFGIKMVQRNSSTANFVMQVLTAVPYLCNPELYRSKLIWMFIELCLQSGYNLASIGFLLLEKFHDDSLIIFHPRRWINDFTTWKEDYFENPHSQINSIYLTFRRLRTLEICWPESQTPEPSRGGWYIYLSIIR
jgi:hypothetical protein